MMMHDDMMITASQRQVAAEMTASQYMYTHTMIGFPRTSEMWFVCYVVLTMMMSLSVFGVGTDQTQRA